MKSYLISGLIQRFEKEPLEVFQKAHPDDWLLWEPGAWRPGGSSTLILSPEQRLRAEAPKAGEALALVLDSKKEQLTLGRGDTCDFAINDGTLSTVHLNLMRAGTSWTVRDAGSRNGSWLNGAKLEAGKPLPLVNGAQLRAGQVALTYYSPAGMLARIRQAAGR